MYISTSCLLPIEHCSLILYVSQLTENLVVSPEENIVELEGMALTVMS